MKEKYLNPNSKENTGNSGDSKCNGSEKRENSFHKGLSPKNSLAKNSSPKGSTPKNNSSKYNTTISHSEKISQQSKKINTSTNFSEPTHSNIKTILHFPIVAGEEQKKQLKLEEVGPDPIYRNPRNPPDEFKVWLKTPPQELLITTSQEDREQEKEIQDCQIPLGAGKANLPGWRDKMFGETERFRAADEKFRAPEELTKQRGVFFSVKEDKDPFKHMEEAVERFLSVKEGSPGEGLDEDLVEAVHYHANSSDEEIVKRLEDFKTQWGNWKDLKGYKGKVEELRKGFDAPLQLDPYLLQDTFQRMGVGGQQFCRRLEKGMPLTGVYDEPGIWARRRGRNKKNSINVATLEQYLKLQKTLLKDIKKIAKSQSDEENERAWSMLDKDYKDGFYQGPFKPHEVPDDLKNFLPARFFVTNSGGKDRAIINAARSRLNNFTEVRTPITLDGPQQVIAVAKLLSSIDPEIELASIKKDQSDAYKSLNLHPSQKKFACVALIIPPGKDDSFEIGEVALYFSKTLFFGAESAVVLYNTLSRSLTALMRRMLGLPALAFYDDFLIITRSRLIERIRVLISEIFEIFQIKLRAEKDEFGVKVTWLGVIYDWSKKKTPKLDISERRKKNLISSLDETIHSARIEKDQLHKLIGRLESVQQVQMGRVGRPFIFPLYTKLYGSQYNAKISKRALRALKWWRDIIRKEDLGVQVPLGEEKLQKFIIYTDATLKKKGFVLCKEGDGEKSINIQEGGWDCSVEGQSITYYELEAAVEILEQATVSGPNCVIYLFVDNVGAQSILQRGWCAENEELSALAERGWKALARKKTRIWIERVPSLANPSDWNSREEWNREWFFLWGKYHKSREGAVFPA